MKTAATSIRTKFLLALLGLSLLLCPVSLLAAPSTINFQGYLTDASDNPVNSSSLSMTFTLFDAVTAGASVWTETQSVEILNGKYNAILGSVAPLASDVFSSDDLWLEIQVGTDTLSPRQKLSSVAYALNSGESLSTGSVTSSHILDGTITASDLAANSVTSSHIQDGTIAKVDLAFTPLSNPHTGDFIVTGEITSEDIQVNDDLRVADQLYVEDQVNTTDVYVGGSAYGSGDVYVYNSSGVETIHLDSATNNGGELVISHEDGHRIASIGESDDGGKINLVNSSSYTTVQIFGDDGAGNGRITLNGSNVNDYAEYFHLTNADEIKPGMVVSIDPDHPGSLMLSSEAYDKKVAGIISGAGDKVAGMIIGPSDEANRNKPVSVSGMVYCYVDANEASVEAGDLLTTSPTLGYAMKAAAGTFSHGTILGKAMEALPEGKGLILVFVTLQ